MTPVSFMTIHSVTSTIRIMRITRSTARVGGQEASIAAFVAVRAISLVSCFDTIVGWLVVESAYYSTHGDLIRIGDAAKLNAKGIGSSVVHNFTMQRQGVFGIHEQ